MNFIKKNIVFILSAVALVFSMTIIGVIFYPKPEQPTQFGDVLSPSYFKLISGNVQFVTSSWGLKTNASTTFNGVKYIWPAADGSVDQRLTTNGSGILSWATVTGGSGGGGLLLYNNTKNLYYVGTTTAPWVIGAAATTSPVLFQVIGTSNLQYASSTALTVSGTASTTDLYVSGNVGIGTTTPTEKLVISGTGKLKIGDQMDNLGGKLRVTLDNNDTETQGIKVISMRTTGTNYGYNGTAAGVGAAQNIGLYSWASDGLINWGLYVQAGDTILDGGKTGIGTTTPFAKLAVTGSGIGTGNLVQFANSANSPKFTLLDNGNIGIGTTTPDYLLTVYGTASSTGYYGAGLQTCNATTGKLTWSGGVFACGTDYNTGGGTGGPGTVSTSTSPTIGNLAYWTSKDAYPETLGTVATTTLTGTAPIVFSQPISVIGGVASVITCNAASGAQTGCLSSANWTTFNSKQDALTFTYPLVNTGGTVTFPATSTLYGTGSYGQFLMWGTQPTWTPTSTLSITKSQISDLGVLFTQALASTTFVDRAAWTSIDNYPTGCTNQFIRTIGDTLTCATVGAADVSLANLTAIDTTLTFSGTYTGATARTIGLNLGNANTWTALQTFGNASTTLFSSTYASSTSAYFGTAYIPSLGTAAGSFIAVNASGQIIATSTPAVGGSGTVTSIATTYPLTGGTITTSGTLSLAGMATSTLTATGPLALSQAINVIGAANSILTCTTASSGVAGCLSSTAFDTFNNKQATISATWPITLTGAAVGFNGLSTSSAAVVSNIPYFSGVNTFANVATTTLTATAPLSLDQPVAKIGGSNSVLTCAAASASVAGCLSSANWTTFNNKVDTTVATLSSLSSIGTITTGTWNATPITTIYGGTGLGAGGLASTFIPFGNGTSAFATSSAFYFTTASSRLTVTNASTTQLSIDATTGRLYIPANTDPLITATGDIGINTTAASSSIRFFNGTAERALYPEQQRTITVASTTLWNKTGTTTIPLGAAPRGETWTRTLCYTDVGTAGIQFGNFTASSTYQSLSTTLNNVTQTNTFSLYQKRYMVIGTLATNPNYITCTIYFYQNAD